MENFTSHKRATSIPLIAALASVLFSLSTAMYAQTADAAESIALTVTSGDVNAVAGNSHFIYQAFPARTAAGQAAPRKIFSSPRPKMKVLASPNAAITIPAVPSPGFYPADLSFFGGPVLTGVQSHALFVNCPSTCWGNPVSFLQNLGASNFIHVVDQYINLTTDNRYTAGASATINETIFGNTLGENDLAAIIHAGAAQLGTGYGHIYHVFLPKGVDTCFDQTNQCYSPDNPASFVFCAYHGYVDFADIGHVIFSIEPFQNVPGCAEIKPFPNGAKADSTNSTLSHELIEAITDPDLNAWFSEASLDEGGAEIADECVIFGPDPISVLNGHTYKIQFEYSNVYHACAGVP
jgi:hypothetical protein